MEVFVCRECQFREGTMTFDMYDCLTTIVDQFADSVGLPAM